MRGRMMSGLRYFLNRGRRLSRGVLLLMGDVVL